MIHRLFSFALACCLAAAAMAQTAPLTVEEAWKPPQLASPTLSRSGKYLAATAPHKGRMNLLVMDLDTRKGTLLTSFDDYDVVSVNWVGDERLVFSLGQFNSPTGAGQFDGGGLFVIGRDGSGSRRLAATVRETRARNQTVYRSLELCTSDSTQSVQSPGQSHFRFLVEQKCVAPNSTVTCCFYWQKKSGTSSRARQLRLKHKNTGSVHANSFLVSGLFLHGFRRIIIESRRIKVLTANGCWMTKNAKSC